jgi:phospholipase A1
VKFRVALRYRLLGAPRGLLDRLFGGKRSEMHDTGIHFSFRQNSFWNIYSESAPFLDNNYNPGVFVYLDGADVIEPRLKDARSYTWWYFPSFKFAVEHESNGRDSVASRGWNRVIGSVELGDPRLHKVYSSASFWGVFGGLSGNPDLKETNGRGEVRLYWQPLLRNKKGGLDRFGFSVFARVGGRRAIVSTETSIYGNPFYHAKNSWAPTFMAQLFCGTGQFLLDHRRDECALRLGTAFIR